MHAFFAGVDRADTKNTIRDMFLENALYLDLDLSRAKADKLAQKYKRGRMVAVRVVRSYIPARPGPGFPYLMFIPARSASASTS